MRRIAIPGLPGEEVSAPSLDPTETDFARLFSLLELTINPAAFKMKLEELKDAMIASEKASAELSRERTAHEARAQKQTAELVAREAAVREREVAVFIAEGRQKDAWARLNQLKTDLGVRDGRFRKIGETGLVQEFTEFGS
jgi:hypothetical protein